MKRRFTWLLAALFIMVASISHAGPEITQENSYAPGAVAVTGGTITGVTIDNSVIGATTPAAGTFTTLTGNVSIITDSATGNVTAAQMKGQTHIVTGAYTLSLPTAAVGYKAKFKASTAAVFSIDLVTGTDVIQLNGTALTAGNKATTDGTENATLQVECNEAGIYEVNSVLGIAIDGGA